MKPAHLIALASLLQLDASLLLRVPTEGLHLLQAEELRLLVLLLPPAFMTFTSLKVMKRLTMEQTDSNDSAPEDACDFDYAVADVCGIEVPEGQWETYDQYRVAVNSIRRNPELADSPNCIVCGDNHRFAQCPILNNADFLRQHYIRYCQLCNRDRQLRESSAQAPNQQRNNARVNVLDVDDFDALMRDDADRDIEDFQNGRS